MSKFRKKPIVIEAVQVSKHMGLEPQWFGDAVTANTVLTFGMGKFGDGEVYCLIDTSEGRMKANDGDWIIKGIKGELYPCKPDIFAATYEDARAPASANEDARDAVLPYVRNGDGCSNESYTERFGVVSPKDTRAPASANEDYARRYEWLRSQGTSERVLDGLLYETISDDCNPPYRAMKHGKDLDAAIDDAMGAKP